VENEKCTLRKPKNVTTSPTRGMVVVRGKEGR